LPDFIQEKSISALKLLAEAESAVHNVPVEKIHFHEVGAVDTIVDIVGACVAMHALQVESLHCTSVPWSRGTVKTEHGILPVPPPAVAILLRDVPVTGVDIDGETVTPTGATLVRTLVTKFGEMPSMRVSRVGYGAGQREWPDRPNVLRLMIGESAESVPGLIAEQLTQTACNIDDMNPEWYTNVINQLYEAQALDVWLTPVQMKKNRPGIVVEVLSRPENADAIGEVLLRHTSTLGVRQQTVARYSLPRKFETVETIYGMVRMKVASLPGGAQKASPEHDDCAARASEKGVSVGEVWLAAMKNWRG
ncbi:MAG TPA: nickel pincer cofactor biosynthesis protein LarC, partial [Pyrinomonadaceae bacterium]|nr:nickel pincer cofactor biosynthesis protein LarC [Pyrinomonadaceae bacterium]